MPEDPSPAPPDPKRSRRRLLAWVVGLLGATATAVIVPLLAQNANSLIAHVTTTGQPVAIHVELQPSVDDVSLPAGQRLSNADLATLSTMAPDEGALWLADHKNGVITSTRTLALTLTGNRPEPVRITGMSVDSSCRKPDRGTIVRMQYGRGAGVASERMEIDAEALDPQAYAYDANSKKQPYFPNRTIVLARGEEQEVVVDVNPRFDLTDDPAKVRVCDVRMSLRLLHQGTASTESVPGAVRVMGIEPFAADDSYAHVFLGTGICKTVVVAPHGWMQGAGQAANLGCGSADNVADR